MRSRTMIPTSVDKFASNETRCTASKSLFVGTKPEEEEEKKEEEETRRDRRKDEKGGGVKRSRERVMDEKARETRELSKDKR